MSKKLTTCVAGAAFAAGLMVGKPEKATPPPPPPVTVYAVVERYGTESTFMWEGMALETVKAMLEKDKLKYRLISAEEYQTLTQKPKQ